MTKLRVLGIILWRFGGSSDGPATARPVAKHPATQVCDPRDPGNPYSQKYDYWSWAAFRWRGSWDTRAEWTCQPIPPIAYQKGWLVEH